MRLRDILQARQTIKAARELVRDTRQARRDGEVSEEEARQLVADAFSLAEDVVGAVELSASSKAVLKAGAEEILRRLG
jgi:hypothetical protein